MTPQDEHNEIETKKLYFCILYHNHKQPDLQKISCRH